ncbi:MAG TPA: DUF1800 domain-containing protein [Terriglobales bacterium]|nr:DUF1800 domain-containing protein [Terriglobales bacterium]
MKGLSVMCKAKNAAVVGLVGMLLTVGAGWAQQPTTMGGTASAPARPASGERAAASAKASSAKVTAKLTANLTNEQRALHALNRLTFGPRPGDLQKVMDMDVNDWIEQQLHPEEIGDGVLDGKLGPLRTLRMSTRDLVQTFPNNNLVRQAAEGKIPLPSDPMKRSIYEVQISILAERQKQDQAARDGKTMDADTKAKMEKQNQDSVATQADTILALPKEKRMEAILALPADDRRIFVTNIRGAQRDRLLADFPGDQREVFLAMNGPVGVITSELQQAKLLRALYSERQLLEVMTDFWFNHFNVFLNKDADQYLTTAYERDVIRAHALGKFKDLLVATAQSPAMLFYLDNWLSMGPNSPAAVAANKGKPGQAVPGLNENYGRELMELHTLSVTGGYTQHDVTELARVLTGWTIQPLEQGAAFQFDAKKHEPGDKVVVGQTIPENGMNEGMQVLDMLAHHPNTAKFICRKLAMRFVADDPPPALVERMAAKFLVTDGDIREVLRTLFKSPEFWSAKAYRAKVKTPFEFVISSLRATGTDLNNPGPMLGILNKMGMPLYQMVPPTGYSMTASTWMNSEALIDRMNFALALSDGKVGGTNFDAGRLLALGTLTSRGFPRPNPADSEAGRGQETALLLIENALLNGEVSANTQKAIRRQLDDPQVAAHALDDPKRTLNTMTALVIGSPEFQHR